MKCELVYLKFHIYIKRKIKFPHGNSIKLVFSAQKCFWNYYILLFVILLTGYAIICPPFFPTGFDSCKGMDRNYTSSSKKYIFLFEFKNVKWKIDFKAEENIIWMLFVYDLILKRATTNIIEWAASFQSISESVLKIKYHIYKHI